MADNQMIEVLSVPEEIAKFGIRKKDKITLIQRETNTHWFTSSVNYPIIPKQIDADNAPSVLFGFSALIPEYFSRQFKIFDAWSAQNYQQDIRMPDGVYSPDYHNDYLIVEFKTFLRQYDPQRVKNETESVKRYLRYGLPIRLIFITFGQSYLDQVGIDERDRSMLTYLQGQIYRHWGILHPRFESRESELPVFSDALKDIPFEKLLPEHIRNSIYNTDYTPLEELDEQVFDLFNIGEDFVDHNMLDQEEFMERVSTMYESPQKYIPNINWKHLWDRDKNREWAGTSFGHRADYLLDFPVFNSSEGNIPFEDFDHLLSLAEDRDEQKIVKYFRFYLQHQKEIENISEMTKTVAYLKSEFNGIVEEKKTDRFILVSKKKMLEETIRNRESYIKEFNRSSSMEGFVVTGQGYLVPNDKTIDTIRNYAKAKRSKKQAKDGSTVDPKLDPLKTKDEQDCINWLDDPTEFENVLEDLFNRAPKETLTIPELSDVYLNNPILNKNSLSLLTEAKDNLHDIFKSQTCRMLYGQMKASTCLLMNDRRTGQASGNTDAFRINRVPGQNVLVLSGLAPNGITSGYIWTIGIHTKGTKVPAYIPPTRLIPLESTDLWITGPYRTNRKVLNKAEQLFGGFVSTCLMYQDFEIPIHENQMYCSMYLRYTRQLAAVADLVYLAYKNVYSFFTIGKYEFLDKFSGIHFRDPRVAYIFNKLKFEYPKTVATMRERALSDNLKFNFVDPVFGFMHTSAQSFLSVTYIKQIFAKDDGFDEKHKAFEFMKKEKKHQDAYDESPFNHKQWGFENRSMSDFIKAKFPEGGKTHKINSFSFLQSVCYGVTKEVIEGVMAAKPIMRNQDNFRSDLGIDTGSNKKVLMPLNQSLVKQAIASKQESQPRTPGICSCNLTEALTLEDLAARKFFKDDAALPKGHPDKIFSNSLYDHLDKEALRLQDLVLYEILHYPTRSIVTIVIKEQSGYDKRIFFVQTINKRNLHVLLESAWFNILRNTLEDMITVPGDEKLVKIEKAIHEVSPTSNDYIVFTIDQTRFGDEYPLYALMFLYIVGFQTGYLSKEQAWLGLFSLYTRMERFEILPADTLKLVTDKKKMKQFIEEHGSDHELIQYIIQNSSMFDASVPYKVFNEEINKTFTDKTELYKLRGLIKEVGFVLGVENFGASMLSLTYMWWSKRLMSKRGLSNILRGHTHSDDAYMAFGARLRQYVDFSRVHLKVRKQNKDGSARISFMDAFKRAKSVTVDNKAFKTTVVTDEGVYVYPNKYIIKMMAVISITMSSLIGQRTSLGKWMCSPQGEVLQAYIINRKVITPLVRYVSSLYADLPGKSPASDLSGVSGRLYNINNHGGSMVLSAGLQLFMNIYIYRSYGVHLQEETQRVKYITNEMTSPLTTRDRWIYPTELTGFWFAHPTMIVESGFKANEIRLQINANKSEKVRVALEVMSDTDDIWLQKSRIELSQMHTTESMNQSDTVIDASPNESDTGAPESRRDFQIHWARNYKTNRAFNVLFTKILPAINFSEIMATIPLEDRSRPGRVVKSLCNQWKIDELLYTKEAAKKFMFFLKRYLSATFQESYLRIHDAVKVINKFGWLNRSLSWCFSDMFTRELDRDGVPFSPSMTVRSIIELISTKISNKSIESIKGAKIRQLYLTVYDHDISVHDSYIREIKRYRKKALDIEYILSWETSITEDKRSILSFPFKPLAARLMEVYTPEYSKYKDPMNSLFFDKFPYLRYNELFNSQVKTLYDLLQEAGIPPEKIIDHMTLLERLLKGVTIKRTGRFPDITALADRYEELQRDRVWDYEVRTGSTTQTLLAPPLQIQWSEENILEVLQLVKWMKRLAEPNSVHDQSIITYRGTADTLANVMSMARDITTRSSTDYKKYNLEIGLAMFLINIADSAVPTGERRFYRKKMKGVTLLGLEDRDEALLLRVYHNKSSFNNSATFGVETTKSGVHFIARNAKLLTYLFCKKSERFEWFNVRQSRGNLQTYMSEDGKRTIVVKPESSLELMLLAKEDIMSTFRTMERSTQNTTTGILAINQPDFQVKLAKRSVRSEYYMTPDSKFYIDNWMPVHPIHALKIGNVVVNKIEVDCEQWEWDSGKWSDGILGFAVGWTGFDSSSTQTNLEYMTPMGKVCLMSKLMMMTGLNEYDLTYLEHAIQDMLNDEDFIINNDGLITSLEQDFKRSEADFPRLGTEQRTQQRPFNMVFEYSKKVLARSRKDVPLMCILPIPLIRKLHRDGRYILSKNLDYIMTLRREKAHISTLITEYQEAFSKPGASFAVMKDNRERIFNLLDTKSLLINSPLGSPVLDCKIHRNNLSTILALNNVDGTKLMSALKRQKAAFRTGFTKIVWDRVISNVPDISWVERYFFILH